MAETYYAWSPILHGRDEKTGAGQYLSVGDAVTPDKVGLKDDDRGFRQLIESGAIRTVKPPKMPDDWTGSILDFLQARDAEKPEEERLMATDGSGFSPPAETTLMGVEPAVGPPGPSDKK